MISVVLLTLFVIPLSLAMLATLVPGGMFLEPLAAIPTMVVGVACLSMAFRTILDVPSAAKGPTVRRT